MLDHLRRRFLQQLIAGGGLGLAGAMNALPRLAGAQANEDRILVVFELSGGNDGLNTVVPYTN
ncbi:MAG: DUF1501 domain-containing protein, partial [Gammaproteobacteria bacterium]